MSLRLTLLILAIISLLTIGTGGLFLTTNLTHTAEKIALHHTEMASGMIQKEVELYLSNKQMSSNSLARSPQLIEHTSQLSSVSATIANNVLENFCITQYASICYLLFVSA